MLLHLLDGTYEMFRAYFAFPSRVAPDGQEVGAVRGVIDTTIPLLLDPELTHIGVATDHVIESFRNYLYEGYKTGEGLDPVLWAQKDLVEEAFGALGMVVWPVVEFEADDAIATAVRLWKDKVDQVVILSPDKDLAQCVEGDRVVTFNRKDRVRLDEEGIVAKFGVVPESIPDYLALVGDAADGIPGLPGWGAKSAAAVLGRYRHLEDIPPTADLWDVQVRSAERLAFTLADHREDAELFRVLTTLRTDVPIDDDFDRLRWEGIDRPGSRTSADASDSSPCFKETCPPGIASDPRSDARGPAVARRAFIDQWSAISFRMEAPWSR